MSQPRGHDPDAHGPRPAGGGGGDQHPDEALAAYVDGSASAAEVELARAHLSSCARCREEVLIARHAVRVMKDLPELNPPWVDAEPPLEAAVHRRTVPERPVGSLAERRSRTRSAVVAAVGLAAAASVAAILILVNLGGPSTNSAAVSTSTGGAGIPNVTGDDLSQLTGRLAGSARAPGAQRASSPEFAGAQSSPSPDLGRHQLAGGPTIAPDAVAGVPCARRASGQSDSAVVVYAQVAVFQGKRVWVVGFVTTPTSGGQPRVEVVAATTNGCTIVYVSRQPLASSP